MAYPPPPGTNSLPARPPASASSSAPPRSGFRPAFSSTQQPSPQPSFGPQGYPGAPPNNSRYGGASYSSYPAPGGGRGANPSTQSYASYPTQQSYGAQPMSYGAQNQAQTTFGAAPQIRNPFPTPAPPAAPGAAPNPNDFDPDMAAQIAQWQSAYSSNDAMPPAAKDGKPVIPTFTNPTPEIAAAAADVDKKKTVARQGGGKKWTDDTLLEWDPSHLRLFVGNLAGETTDESLLKAFSGWKSVQKARVVRDKRTTKSKGFGFVSFSDADDFFQAAKEMNGKYIQSHPVVIRKANTEIKVTNVKQKGHGGKWSNKKKNGNAGNGSGGHADSQATMYEPQLGPVGNNGIVKPGQKTKNGLRLLG